MNLLKALTRGLILTKLSQQPVSLLVESLCKYQGSESLKITEKDLVSEHKVFSLEMYAML